MKEAVEERDHENRGCERYDVGRLDAVKKAGHEISERNRSRKANEDAGGYGHQRTARHRADHLGAARTEREPDA